MVQATSTVFRGQINSLAPNSNHKDKLWKLVTFCTPSDTQRKGKNKANPQPTDVLGWKYKNVNYLNTVLLQRNVLAETKAMPVQ